MSSYTLRSKIPSRSIVRSGRRLVAYELKRLGLHIGVGHIECQGYAMPNTTPTAELVGAWLVGECYG